MNRKLLMLVIVGMVAVASVSATYAAARAKAPAPNPADEPDDGIQGEYAGTYRPSDAPSPSEKAEAKVIGEGGGTYRCILTLGEGDKAVKVELKGKAEDDGRRVRLAGETGGANWSALIEKGKALSATSGKDSALLTPAVRKSPTEGAKPPPGAIVLLPFEEGKKPSLDAWADMKGGPAPWVPQDDGSILVRGGNIQTRQEFTNVRLHVEFRCPYMPAARGQGRGNSGVYLQSRYECQVLDSFGLPPKDNECGGLYSVSTPKVIASLPPGRWQTYDITFHAPTVEDGKIAKPATMSVVHNGIEIHKDVKIDHVTTAGVSGPIKSPAPLMLQDHGNPVRYRNIWLVELKE
ncbi:MAG: DUF1080 domain-containing protein [Planctomycetota bacterium]|nr:DUF1080 domain-containing protein [Planctomycetota bacterium]